MKTRDESIATKKKRSRVRSVHVFYEARMQFFRKTQKSIAPTLHISHAAVHTVQRRLHHCERACKRSISALCIGLSPVKVYFQWPHQHFSSTRAANGGTQQPIQDALVGTYAGLRANIRLHIKHQ